MPVDGEGARALALARSALTRATDAERVAQEAKEGHRSVYEALGAQLHEIARLSAGLREVSERTAGIERLVKEGFHKLGTVAVQAKRAAMKSGHDLEQWKEDSTVTDLRKQRDEAKAKFDSLRARDKSIRGWVFKVLALVVGGVVLTWLSIKLGLKP